MSSGLRNQRIRVFGHSNTDTDGYPGSSYPYLGEYWGRCDAPSMREATVAGQAQHQADAVFTLERGIVVPADGALKADGRYYKVTGIPPANRMANEIKVFAEFADDATIATTGEPA